MGRGFSPGCLIRNCSLPRIFVRRLSADPPVIRVRQAGATSHKYGVQRDLGSLPWEMELSGATLSVNQTFPPITERAPIVILPRIVAPA